jgi:hypothetical protein
MTPISRFYEKFLPNPAAILAVILTYSFMLISIAALLGYSEEQPTVYIDIQKPSK